MGEYLLSLSRDHTGTATHTYYIKVASNISLRAVTIRHACDHSSSFHLSVSTATWTKKNLKIRISKILLRTRRLVIISCRHYNKSEIKKYTTKKKILAADTSVAVHKVPLYPCSWGEYCALGQPAEYRPTSAVQVWVYWRMTRCKYYGVNWEITKF